MRSGSIKVLVVDDSPFVRSALTRVLDAQPDIVVAGGAKDPYEARDLIIECRPDVIILDTEMPRMDGITFLGKLMEHYPVPVIMCADPSDQSRDRALEAIERGATDVVIKPTARGRDALRALGEQVAFKVRAAYVALRRPPPPISTAAQRATTLQAAGLDPARYLVAIGASTGGTEAIRDLLARVPVDFPPVAIVQHMPAGFTAAFANRLNHLGTLTVREARDGDTLAPGVALVARGGVQMKVRRAGGTRRIAFGSTEPVNLHCPSVDVMFDSVAKAVGKDAVGILLTGMGGDGAEGLLTMRKSGAVTLAQNRESCVVYGMPKVAVDLKAAQITGTPSAMPSLIIQALRNRDCAAEPTSC